MKFYAILTNLGKSEFQARLNWKFPAQYYVPDGNGGYSRFGQQQKSGDSSSMPGMSCFSG
jgi:hypothetical protein